MQRAAWEPETLLTPDEVADAFRVSRSTIRRWTAEGKLTGVRIGVQLRYRASDIEQILALGTEGGAA